MEFLRGRARPEGHTVEIKAPCVGVTSTFYGPHVDLRDERKASREFREARCRAACQTCFMRLECLSFALLGKEIYGVWGGMSPGDRREFRKKLKKIYGDKWKEAVGDFDKLRFREEVFLRKKEEERAKLQRQEKQASRRSGTATAVAIGTGRQDVPRTRPVTGRNRSGATGAGRSKGRGSQAREDELDRATRKAASPKQDHRGRRVQR